MNSHARLIECRKTLERISFTHEFQKKIRKKEKKCISKELKHQAALFVITTLLRHLLENMLLDPNVQKSQLSPINRVCEVWGRKKSTTIVETPWLMCQLTNQDEGVKKHSFAKPQGCEVVGELSKHRPPGPSVL